MSDEELAQIEKKLVAIMQGRDALESKFQAVSPITYDYIEDVTALVAEVRRLRALLPKVRQVRHLLQNGSYAYPAGGHEAMRLFEEIEATLSGERT